MLVFGKLVYPTAAEQHRSAHNGTGTGDSAGGSYVLFIASKFVIGQDM